MPKLPVLTSKAAVKIFEKAGYFVVRQKGSHIRMYHDTRDAITVPNHKIIGRGLLKKLLRDSQITVGELITLVER